MLLSKEKITQEFIKMLATWRHSGFSVFCGERIHPHQKRSMERLAAYLIRASFSQERMQYFPEQLKVIYHSKDGNDKKTYNALEWLAAMGSPVPNRAEQSIRYYGYYSNCSICKSGSFRYRCILSPVPKSATGPSHPHW
jgi:hypothetical protein